MRGFVDRQIGQSVDQWISRSVVRCIARSLGQNLFSTSNLIGSCWPEALLFQSWGSLLLLFGSAPPRQIGGTLDQWVKRSVERWICRSVDQGINISEV